MKKHLLAPVLIASLLLLSLACQEKAGESAGSETSSENNQPIEKAKNSVSTIAFGSCSHEHDEQVMWQPILENQPDLWIWLGDNVYGDTEDMAELKAKYDQQKSNPDYQKLRAQAGIIGIWDDHDYGANDAGKEYPKKKESRDLMFAFLDVPQDNPAWQREGGYTAWEYGEGARKVKVILLDARYFRDPLQNAPRNSGRRYDPSEGDFLGEAQWAWLEAELTDSDAAIHLIGCGIQFIPEEHGWEKWGNFPKARQRFFDLLAKTKPNAPILLSGDRHIAEFSKLDIGLPHPVYEVTASGLTHTWGEAQDEPNQHRVGDLIVKKNFGVIQIDWDKQPLVVTLQIRGEENALHHELELVY